MSYNAGNIRVSGQPTSSQILWINPEVGTKWALTHFFGSRLRTSPRVAFDDAGFRTSIMCEVDPMLD
jgi:hypothetical protein